MHKRPLLPLLLLSLCAFPLQGAVHVWTGASSERFSDAGNWVGGSPAGDAEAELTFPSSAVRLTATNDLPSLVVRTLSITTTGYRIDGQRITLAAGAEIVNTAEGANELAADVELSGGVNVLVSNGSLTFSGIIGGIGPFVKQGFGSATFSGTRPNTYSGSTNVLNGELLLGKSDGVNAVPGDVLAGITGVNSEWGTIITVADEQIPDSAKVTIKEGATTAIGGTETIGPLEIESGGSIHTALGIGGRFTSTGTLILGGDVDLVNEGFPTSNPAHIDGDVALAHSINITSCDDCAPLEISSLREVTPGSGLILRGFQPAFGRVAVTHSSYSGPTIIEGAYAEVENPRTAVRLLRGRFEGNVASLVAEAGTVTTVKTAGDLRLSPATTVHTSFPPFTPSLIAGGTLDLSNARLEWEEDPNFNRILGNTYLVARNDGPNPIRGTFSEVPEGTVLRDRFRISYTGGDGNDITITEAGHYGTRLDLNANPRRAADGQSVTLFAEVLSFPAVNGGQVAFREGATLLGTVPVDGTGVARLTIQPRYGVHEYTATYEGTATFAPSSSTVSVTMAGPTATLTSVEPSTVQSGTTVTLTIHGTGFVPEGSVRVEGNRFDDVFVSPTELRVTWNAQRRDQTAVVNVLYAPPFDGVFSNPLPLVVEGRPIPESPITFTAIEIRGSVIPRGGAAWLGLFQRFSAEFQSAITPDTDGDGIVKWEHPQGLSPRGLWLMTDMTDGQVSSGDRDDHLIEPQPFPHAMFVRDAQGRYSHVLSTLAGVKYQQWVRPGVGAWTLLGGDAGLGDLDGRTNGIMVFDVSQMAPVGNSPPPPAGIEPGDVFLGVSGLGVWAGGKVDEHLPESDGPGSLRFAEPLVVDGVEGATAPVTVIRVGGSDGEVSVRYTTVNDSATAGVLYTAVAGTLVFGPGEIVKTIQVPLLDDSLYSGSTRFKVVLSEPAGAPISGSDRLDVRISDNEEVPRLTLSPDVTVPEGDEGTHEIPMTVTLSGPTRLAVTARFTYALDNGVSGEEHLTFLPGGATSKTVSIRYEANRIPEADRRYHVHLADVVNADSSNNDRVATVADDDFTTLTLLDATVRESQDHVRVTIATTIASLKPVRVHYTTVSGSATAGSDFTTTSGIAEFDRTGSNYSADIPILQDANAEGPESFTLVLSDPVNATIRRGTATIVIADDESAAMPVISAGALVVPEAFDAFAFFRFRLSFPSTQEVRFRARTVGGSATPNADFVPKDEVLVIPAGSTEVFFEVRILDDFVGEPRETFSIALSEATGATIATLSVAVTIVDDEEPALDPNDAVASVAAVTVAEGDGGLTSARFTVTLSHAESAPVTIAYATADGTAVAPEDYVAVAGSLTFAPGETSKVVEVAVIGDVLAEEDETFSLVLGNGAAAAARVTNDDQAAGKGRSVRH